ncbi:MAG: AglZ/HisF2 family acetamidino modification protein [Pseudohongiella sp.]|nr:AglZ/HisF2 family acetamidino modification protein [Pseudohongiella sp.]
MLNHRVIPCLLLSNGGLVKTTKFKNGVYVGDPINAIRIFNDKEVDELVLLDIRASLDNREPCFELISEIASECFMPLSYGGGISNMNHIQRLFRLGIEKVIFNTALYKNPELIRETVRSFGSQSVTASIDVKRKLFRADEVMTLAATKGTGMRPVEAARYAEDLGVGEILLTSIDQEGSMSGYDLDLLATVSRSVTIPIIASGGAGSLNHFRSAIIESHASAVAAGSMFVFYGPHRAVLISYPKYQELCELFR